MVRNAVGVMKLYRIFRTPVAARDAADFVLEHLRERGAVDYFSEERFKPVIELARHGAWSEAAKEYRSITGAGIKDSVIAAEIARRIVEFDKH